MYRVLHHLVYKTLSSRLSTVTSITRYEIKSVTSVSSCSPLCFHTLQCALCSSQKSKNWFWPGVISRIFLCVILKAKNLAKSCVIFHSFFCSEVGIINKPKNSLKYNRKSGKSKSKKLILTKSLCRRDFTIFIVILKDKIL